MAALVCQVFSDILYVFCKVSFAVQKQRDLQIFHRDLLHKSGKFSLDLTHYRCMKSSCNIQFHCFYSTCCHALFTHNIYFLFITANYDLIWCIIQGNTNLFPFRIHLMADIWNSLCRQSFYRAQTAFICDLLHQFPSFFRKEKQTFQVDHPCSIQCRQLSQTMSGSNVRS